MKIEKTGTLTDELVDSFNKFLVKPNNNNCVSVQYDTQKRVYDPATMQAKHSTAVVTKNYYCLRFLNTISMVPHGLCVIVTKRNRADSVTRHFYDYIFGPASPWKDSLQYLTLVPGSKKLPRAVIWHDTAKADARQMMSLLTAMRLHTCWGTEIIWLRLVEKGMDPETALILTCMFSWSGQNITSSTGPREKWFLKPEDILHLSMRGSSKTDMPFMPDYIKTGYKPFFDHQPLKTGKWSTTHSVQPCNYIWHTDKKEINADHLSTNDKIGAILQIKGKTFEYWKELLTKDGSPDHTLFKQVHNALKEGEPLEL